MRMTMLVVCILLFFNGCAQKEYIYKKEFIELQTCKIVIPEFLMNQDEIKIPSLKDNSEEELNKVKSFIKDVLQKREDDKVKFIKIKELYEQFLNCSI